MNLSIIIECGSAAELAVIAEALTLAESVGDVNAVDAPAPAQSVSVGPETVPATEPKKRGRKPKSRPDEVLAEIKDSVTAVANKAEAASVPPAPAPTPTQTPTAAATEPPAGITTGQDLQDYILSLVHKKRLDPVAVKATVYPKYGVARSLDLTPEQVPLAKADVDAMLKPAAAPAPGNDLDL